MVDLLAAQRHAVNNYLEIEASTVCGCFYCIQLFPPSEIVAWTGLDLSNFNDPAAANAQTALCPKCGSESVMGDKSGYKIDAQFLGRMHEAWFERTIVHKPKAKK